MGYLLIAAIIVGIYLIVTAKNSPEAREWTGTLQPAGFVLLKNPNRNSTFGPFIAKMTVFQQGKRIGFRRQPALFGPYALTRNGWDILMCELAFNTGLGHHEKGHSQRICLAVGRSSPLRLPYFRVLPRGEEIMPRIRLAVVEESLEVEEVHFEGPEACDAFTHAYAVSIVKGDVRANDLIRELFTVDLQTAIVSMSVLMGIEGEASGLAFWLGPAAPASTLLQLAMTAADAIRSEAGIRIT